MRFCALCAHADRSPPRTDARRDRPWIGFHQQNVHRICIRTRTPARAPTKMQSRPSKRPRATKQQDEAAESPAAKRQKLDAKEQEEDRMFATKLAHAAFRDAQLQALFPERVWVRDPKDGGFSCSSDSKS